MLISYACENLIKEIEQDIAEFGADYPAYGIYGEISGMRLLKDYIQGEAPPVNGEIKEGETAFLMTLGEIHKILLTENDPLKAYETH